MSPLYVLYTVTESHDLVRFMKSTQPASFLNPASFKLLMSLNSEFLLWLISGPNKMDSESYGNLSCSRESPHRTRESP